MDSRTRLRLWPGWVLVLALSGLPAAAAVRKVGKGKAYPAPCAALSAAKDGDTILIDAGEYPGDVCAWKVNGLTIRSTGGRARIAAQGKAAWGKGIWVVLGNDTTIEGIEFSGAASTSKNGAGVRLDGRNLTLRNCYFHHNENGLLTGAKVGQVLIEYCEFADNGAGDGYSHNMYIGPTESFIIRHSYSHRANVGHLVKSRAALNVVEYNRLTDETGKASYELDLPNGGTSYVVGNVFQQGASASNPHVLAYFQEGARPDAPGRALYVVNNTFINNTRPVAAIVVNPVLETPVVIRNNLFVNFADATTQGRASQSNNLKVSAAEAGLMDAAHYDYRLRQGSPAIDFGAAVGPVDGVSLTPEFSFVAPHCRVTRRVAGKAIDAGADEFGNAPSAPECGPGGKAKP